MNQSSPYQTLKSKNDINSLTCVNTGIDKSTCCISYVPWPPFFGRKPIKFSEQLFYFGTFQNELFDKKDSCAF